MTRTRMAPSPTGEFHIGGMRTLLYAYALAKHDKGEFILRIEDTDKNREVEGALERIKQVIHDFGIEWDEYYVQSERLQIYKEHADKLIDAGYAYKCFCTSDRLAEMREQQVKNKLPLMYDKTCRHLSKDEVATKIANGESYVVRLAVPENKDISFTDAVLGSVTFNTSTVDDQVLLKTDGYPTYHLAVVIDDHLMNITHVVRGQEWLSSTPKHVLLYSFFGWQPPMYVHLPNLKEKDSTKKMSKRVGDVHAAAFLEKGYLVDALLNFLMLLGWNPGVDQELFTMQEFIKIFDVTKIHKADLVSFDREKLLWMNGHYIRQLSAKDLMIKLEAWAKKYNVALVGTREDVLELVQERMKLLSEYNDLVDYFYSRPAVDIAMFSEYADKARREQILNAFEQKLSALPQSDWSAKTLEELCTNVLSTNEFKPKEAYMTLRVALTGRTVSPHIFDLLAVLGKEESLARLAAVA